MVRFWFSYSEVLVLLQSGSGSPTVRFWFSTVRFWLSTVRFWFSYS